MTYLPDTNACITLLRQRNPALMALWQAAKASEVLLCSVVVYELRHGAERSSDPAREHAKLDVFLAPFASLPFGGEDSLATIYYYDALQDLAELEEQTSVHPQWCVATGAEAFDPADLRRHAGEVKDYGTRRFWNETAGRFGTVDLDGTLHDYGFTFLNNEAIHYRFATVEQARSVRAWLSGERIVQGDTSQGADIYRWRFGPRSTTKRNVDYYVWPWSAPESIPFGAQVKIRKANSQVFQYICT